MLEGVEYLAMKRSVLFSLCLLLVACGGGGHEGGGCDSLYWDGEIGTCVPCGWEVLEHETLRLRGVPEETIVAFQAVEPVSGQFPTVTITREQLNTPAKPKDYSAANIRSVEVLEGYTHVDTKKTDVDGEEVNMHIFTAQPIESEPRRRFYQVSTVAGATGDVGFTVTAVTPISIGTTTEKSVLLILEGLTFEEPTEEE